MPEPPRQEVYGFKKVSQEELGNIISRLSKPTYNSRVHTVEAHKAHNYRRIHSAPPPRTPTQCSRRRIFTPSPNNIIADISTANTTQSPAPTTPHPATTEHDPTADPDPVSDSNNTNIDNVDDGTNTNIKNNNNNNNDNATIDEIDEEEEEETNPSEPTTPAPLLPSPPPPPPPPVPLSERKMTEIELRRFLRRIQRPTRAYIRSRRDYVPEEDDEIMAGDDFATFNAADRNRRPLTATERKKAFFLMSRPTTASRAKSSVECVFCPTDEEELKANQSLDVPFKYPHAPEVKVVTASEASTIVNRVSSPTRASLRGNGPPCYCSRPDYDSVRGQHTSLPLVSGLARTPKVSQIVNRLHYGNTKRLVIVVREEEDGGQCGEQDGLDRRGSRGTNSEDERGRFRRGAPRSKHQQKRSASRDQVQKGRRGYHGYHAAATPITAWT